MAARDLEKVVVAFGYGLLLLLTACIHGTEFLHLFLNARAPSKLTFPDTGNVSLSDGTVELFSGGLLASPPGLSRCSSNV